MAPTLRDSPHWGGPRSGAGRPLHNPPSRCISINLPEELIEILDREANRRRISRSALIAYYLHERVGEASTKKNGGNDPPQTGKAKGTDGENRGR